MIQQLGYGVSGNIGVLGIADSRGDYTYYSDYTSAMIAAKSGDVVVQFANIVERKSITITLKNGVNINLNGFTYTVTTTGIYNFSTTAAVVCSISNGTITGGISINNASANITTNCTINGTVLINAGNLSGGVINGAVITPNVTSGNVTINNICVNGYGSFALNSTTITINNCIFSATGTLAVECNTQNGTRLQFNSCTFISLAGYALCSNNGLNLRTYNCVCISTASVSLAVGTIGGGGEHTNLISISTASFALLSINTTYYNVYAYTTGNNALGGNGSFIIMGSNTYSVYSNVFYGGTLISTVAALIPNTVGNSETARNNSFIGTTLDCQWNNRAGYCVVNSNIVINCFLKTAHRKANAITSTPNTQNPVSCYAFNNTFLGMEKPIADNVILSQQNIPDLYDNILLG